jgi:protein involved in polysaccharide export with SLBB domain
MMSHHYRPRRSTLVACSLGVLLGGAVAAVALGQEPVSSDTTSGLVDEEYRIQLGDELGIHFYYSPELDQNVVVRSDGRIALPLVQEVRVVGMTPASLTALLTDRYSSRLADPEITVMVRSFGAQIFVGGEVGRPGVLELDRPLTLLQAIYLAGGFEDTARRREVVVIRRGEDGRPIPLELRLDKVLNRTDLSQDVLMQPFDVVYVPKTRIANVNKWMAQYIEENIPVTFGLRIDLE